VQCLEGCSTSTRCLLALVLLALPAAARSVLLVLVAFLAPLKAPGADTIIANRLALVVVATSFVVLTGSILLGTCDALAALNIPATITATITAALKLTVALGIQATVALSYALIRLDTCSCRPVFGGDRRRGSRGLGGLGADTIIANLLALFELATLLVLLAALVLLGTSRELGAHTTLLIANFLALLVVATFLVLLAVFLLLGTVLALALLELALLELAVALGLLATLLFLLALLRVDTRSRRRREHRINVGRPHRKHSLRRHCR
jgi:hypothetical protein